ncbi:MAG: hypothetical protein FJ276_19170 [Planctomycetes bacterium]|nr:hypothetical protein [Planctomycetota bacterium]
MSARSPGAQGSKWSDKHYVGRALLPVQNNLTHVGRALLPVQNNATHVGRALLPVQNNATHVGRALLPVQNDLTGKRARPAARADGVRQATKARNSNF